MKKMTVRDLSSTWRRKLRRKFNRQFKHDMLVVDLAKYIQKKGELLDKYGKKLEASFLGYLTMQLINEERAFE